MPKNIEDMIVPERKRSIRNIPIPEGRRKNNDYASQPLPREPEHESTESFLSPLDVPQVERKSSRINRRSVWMTVGLAVVALVFTALSIFNGATLSYVPKSTVLSFANDIYTARKAGEGELLYSVIKLSENKGLNVPATGKEEVKRKASGIIVVYNANVKEQRLRETTRFETPDGKIYQIKDAITVPGKKMVNGVEKLGVLEVMVYAERPGAEFNIDLSDFTLPGLKGTALFSSVYARSKTTMAGGFAGVEKVVESGVGAQARAQLETALRDELISEAKAQVPEDFIFLPSLSSVTFENLPQTASASENSAILNMRGNLYGVMFKKSDLSNRLAAKKIALAPGELVDVVGLDSVTFSFSGTLPVNLLLSDEIKFAVTGVATAIWYTDEVALKTDLIGKHKDDIPSILRNYPTVISTAVTFRPFWKKSFPDNGADITIKKLPVK